MRVPSSIAPWRFIMLMICSLALLVAVAGCGGDGEAVGAACERDGDCFSGGRCLTGNKFPGGTCTISCRDHDDCPSYAACIDRDEGVCLPGCARSSDCRPGYRCDDQKSEGKFDKSYVCINDD